MSPRFERRVALAVGAAEAWAWHARPGAFERLAPPWDPVRVLERRGGIEDGARVTVAAGPLRQRWTLEHRDSVPGVGFRDVQVSGPFARWTHEHAFEPAGERRCALVDRIDWALPALLAAGTPWVGGLLRRLFAYRHRVTADDLAMHTAAAAPPLRVLVSGAGGLVGSALVPLLTTGGHAVTRLVRGRAAGPGEAAWDPAAPDPRALEGFDAVVHLAGASLAERWTTAARARMVASRIEATRRLAGSLAGLARPPRVLVAASAIGWYGDRGDERLDEGAAPGRGFLPDLVRDWEAATAPAAARGIRVVNVRTGLALSARGGALPALLRPFAFGAGGPLGDGRQWMSWVALDDLLGILHLALTGDRLAGPVNAVAPEPVTSREFARVAGRVLRRPALAPAPAFALRALLGRAFADEMLLASARVVPAALARAGYAFRFTALEDALRHTLGRADGPPG